ILVEPHRFPEFLTGVLVSRQPSRHLAIYNYPDAWYGLSRESILAMRRSLYSFTMKVDGVHMEPSDMVGVLQRLALAAEPVVLEADCEITEPQYVEYRQGALPTGPNVRASRIRLASDPEVSRVAEKIASKDLASAEAIWRLLSHEYSLDQVAQMLSVGLLGRHGRRRMVPTAGAYRTTINVFINHATLELADRPEVEEAGLFHARMPGEEFFVLLAPGPTRVDYLRAGLTRDGPVFSGQSDVGVPHAYDHVAFSALRGLISLGRRARVIVLHIHRQAVENALSPWTARVSVSHAIASGPIARGETSECLDIISSLLSPPLRALTAKIPVLLAAAHGPDEQEVLTVS
ncbi:MAG: hypothetical protein QXQ81_09475, partial [Candidatus Thorarchaeota archaeon]